MQKGEGWGGGLSNVPIVRLARHVPMHDCLNIQRQKAAMWHGSIQAH